MSNKNENTGKSGGRAGLIIGIALAGIVAVVAIVLFKNNAGPAAPREQQISSASPQKTDATSGTKANPAVGATAAAKPSAGGSPVSDLITQFKAQLKQPNVSPAEKKKLVVELAKTCSPETLAALKAAFAEGGSDIRQMIAESLSECSSPDAENLLLSLLKDPDDAVAGAAVRALAQLGTAEAAAALNQLLNNENASAGLRADAALGLGQINQPGVMDLLAQAARIPDEDIVNAVLHAMGGRDFAETQPFFQTYLHSPDISSDLRVAAVEALASAQGDPTAFLADLASDPDADVRVAVAWALSATEATGNVGPQLVALLQSETDPDVRLRLYQALRNQEEFDLPTVLGLVSNEKDPGALVAGLDLLAKTVRDQPTDALQKYFNDVAIPELKQIALSPDTTDNRQAAILALTRSRLPGAQAALAEIGTQLAQSTPPPNPAPKK